jgi:hypothetical protein
MACSGRKLIVLLRGIPGMQEQMLVGHMVGMTGYDLALLGLCSDHDNIRQGF